MPRRKILDDCEHESMGPDCPWPEFGLVLNTCPDCCNTIEREMTPDEIKESEVALRSWANMALEA